MTDSQRPPPAAAPRPEADSKPTLAVRVEPEIEATIQRLLPYTLRMDGARARKSDVTRGILLAVLEDPDRLAKILAAPGESFIDKIRHVLDRGLALLTEPRGDKDP